MSEDYYITLIKDIIENNDKDEAIKIIANKLNEKQISNEKEMLTNLDKDKEIERLNNIRQRAIIKLENEIRYLKHLDEIGAMCSTEQVSFNNSLLKELKGSEQ